METREFKHIGKLVKDKRLLTSTRVSGRPEGERMTQKELSHLLGYKNGQFISNVERALCSIPAKEILRLCKTLGLDSEEVIAAMLLDRKEYLESSLKLTSEGVQENEL